jgi:7-cyano-7-deazaguanine synthase in queuosine biosynthesis
MTLLPGLQEEVDVKAVVVFEETIREPGTLYLQPGINITTGERVFSQIFGTLTSLEEDLLILASAIFACDLAFKRGQRENVPRKIELTVPVINHAAFNSILDELRYTLLVLSHDAWDIRFIRKIGTPESSRNWSKDVTGKVLLFSGGLDSFAAAILYGEAGENVQLVSHITANRVVSSSQETLFAYLQDRFSNQFNRIAFRISGRSKPAAGFPFPSDRDREESQRTRSFLFLSLAALTARRRGLSDVILIAENGQMAIHLPLTAGRISAFSTHTAHPEFVHEMGNLLSTLLSHPIHIENPFLYQTKGEVIRNLLENHQATFKDTVSCWKASRVTSAHNHCGICIPCLVRRIAVEAQGYEISEYQRDILREDVGELSPEDDGKRNLMDLLEFVHIFNSSVTQASLENLYPELINEWIDTARAVEMYRRFAAEAHSVVEHYPLISELVK